MVTLAEHAAHTRDMEPHIATLTRLAAGQRMVAEFGVRTGVSTWALLDGMDEFGELWSWDIGLDDDLVADHCRKRDRDRVPERVIRDQRWHLLRQDSAGASHRLGAVDMVLIDSSHEYHHTITELDIAAGCGAGLVVLHDWNLPDVHDATVGFLDRHPYRIEGIEPSDWGLVWLRRS